MIYSQFTLTFEADLVANEKVTIRTGNLDGPWEGMYQYIWKPLRQQSYQVTVGNPTTIPGERSAINFVQAFNLDTNALGLHEVTRVGNVVTVNSTVSSLTFWPPLLSSDLSTKVKLQTNNYEGNILEIIGHSFMASTEGSNCTHYKVAVETNELAQTINLPVSVSNNTDNPFYFERLRGQGFMVNCQAADGQVATLFLLPHQVPSILNSSAIDVQINNSPNGATVFIEVEHNLLELQYSLDAESWQSENLFTGLPEGDYTIFVKDQLGCQTSKQFYISSIGNVEPFEYISKSNSIRFADLVEWGNCSDYKTDENTLSCQANVKLPYKEIQQFQTCDAITTQFLSSREENSAFVLHNGIESELPLQQLTQNLGVRDRRDAFIFDMGDGWNGIYFMGGNVYDYQTGEVSGTYQLNGLLPEWAVPGNYIKVGDAWHLIENIIYNQELSAEVIKVQHGYVGETTTEQVYSIYNRENHEVYEFTIDFSVYLNQNLQVKVVMGDKTKISEVINIRERQDGTVEIRYKNRENTDVYYSTGIEHKIRIPISRIEGRILDESSNHKMDSTVILLDSETHEADVFEFEPITKEMMRKLVQALSHSEVWIEGVKRVKEAIELEGPLEDTNLYVVRATMIKSTGKKSVAPFHSGGSMEVIGLIDNGENGFVQY